MNNRIPAKNMDMLKYLYKTFKDNHIRWILVGSMGLALRNVNVEVHDIDLIILEKDLDKVSKLFDRYAIRPMAYSQNDRLHIKSYIGTYNIEGVQVEIMSNIEHEDHDGWKKTDINKTITHEFEGMDIQMLTLEVEYEAYKKMGRIEKAGKILEVIK